MTHLGTRDRSDAAYLDEAFRLHIDPDIQRAFFAQFDERLTKRFKGDERRAAENVLDGIVAASGMTIEIAAARGLCEGHEIDFDRMLGKLVSQEMLVRVEDEGAVRFPFEILRRWRVSRGAKSPSTSIDPS